MRRAGRGVALALSGFSLCGCLSTADFDRYGENVMAFKTATDKTSQAVAAHILTVREVDRTRMFAQLADTPNPCGLDWVKRRKTDAASYGPADCAFLAVEIVREGRFSREAIAARRQVFDVLNQYTTLLNAVVTSDAPARWESAAKGLGAATGSLVTTVEGVATRGEESKLGPLGELIGKDGPLTMLMSFAGEEWINRRRTEALDAVVTKAKPQVDMISALLREDFEFVRKRETLDANEGLGVVVFDYAEATQAAVADPSKDAMRKSALAKLKIAVVANETTLAEVQSIGSTMDAFDDAHGALVTYAESAQSPKDMAALEPVMQRYASAANDVYDAYKASFDEDSGE